MTSRVSILHCRPASVALSPLFANSTSLFSHCTTTSLSPRRHINHISSSTTASASSTHVCSAPASRLPPLTSRLPSMSQPTAKVLSWAFPSPNQIIKCDRSSRRSCPLSFAHRRTIEGYGSDLSSQTIASPFGSATQRPRPCPGPPTTYVYSNPQSTAYPILARNESRIRQLLSLFLCIASRCFGYSS
ncbi:hypothetical protein B0T10DRAFT_459125 [Thelonectria olida]|uniref:Uncharacterized protein n=1 Tax=Thelonectria olida TaxID=1576542 RepID=A0A9P8W538_9HYPO|nr:hypothetical protein B0T10DRAFT_459125 [Thelonectria olida]